MKARSLAAAVVLALSSWDPAMATPVFVNGLTVPANTKDLSGDPIALNQRVGMFSDIYYAPAATRPPRAPRKSGREGFVYLPRIERSGDPQRLRRAAMDASRAAASFRLSSPAPKRQRS